MRTEEAMVELLPHLDQGPAVMVFLSPNRFRVMTPDTARALADMINAALAQLAPEQLPLLKESA